MPNGVHANVLCGESATATASAEPLARPLFLADWDDVVFVHYALNPAELQPIVPFELDLYEGEAYVSLVAFTQRRLRPARGGRIGALLSRPLANHPFLNVRTYVKHGGEHGIYFLCEWIPNRLATLIGPPLYGLQYRIGRLRYTHDRARGTSRCEIAAGEVLHFEAVSDIGVPLREAEPGTRDAFLLERYIAFTCCRGRNTSFRVRHVPWPQRSASVRIVCADLLPRACFGLAERMPVCANASPGVKDVALGPPTRADATRRQSDRCSDHQNRTGWLPLAAALTLALCLGRILPAWAWMWCIALATFAGFKWQTWWDEPLRRVARARRSAAYLLLWSGMDAKLFLDRRRIPRAPAFSEWIGGLLNIALGAALLWIVCAKILPSHPLLVGWPGMVGMVLVLHFGLFDLLALAWRRAGVDATPLMRNPLRAASLVDLWGRRWNTAFHELTNRLAFRPLVRRVGPPGALLGTFLLSGLVHDLVISVPARGGFGLPTAYFTLQGVGVLFERSVLGRRMGLGRGIAGRVFAIVVAAGPAFVLLHPPFVERVIVPFLHAIGATGSTGAL